MTPPRLLVLHPALAPYRVDTFNALAARTTLQLCFLSANVANQAFDQARLTGLLAQEPAFLLRGLTIAGRTLRLGIGAAIRGFRPDAVVTTEFGQATAAVQLHRALGGGAFAHLVATEDNPHTVAGETRLHRLGRAALLPRVDGVLTYSEAAAALYRGRFGATQPVIASPLVQSEAVLRARLARAGAAALELSGAHGLHGKRVLLYVGRLAPEKRVDRLVDAVGRLREALPEVALVLVGDGPERAALERRAAAGPAGGVVVFAGRQEGDALGAWYWLGGVFALASSHEPFGAVVNEALLAGLPAVVSDRAGAQALVADGENGSVVDAADPAALDRALLSWLRHAPSVSTTSLARPRPSLMRSTFDEAVDGWLHGIEAARQHLRSVRGPSVRTTSR